MAEGVNAVPGCTATLLQVPEIMFEILQKNTDAQAKRDEFKEIPVPSTPLPPLSHFNKLTAFYFIQDRNDDYAQAL